MLINPTYWLELAMVFGNFAVGNILFVPFAAQTPKWRRVLKVFLFAGGGALVSAFAGRASFFVLLGAMGVFF